MDIKTKENIAGAFIASFATTTLVVCILGVARAVACKGWASSETASWVQAAGSVAAIYAAIGIAIFQNQRAIELAKQNQLDETRRKYTAIQAIANRANKALQASLYRYKHPDKYLLNFEAHYDPESLKQAESALLAIPLHETGSVDLVTGVQDTIYLLKNVRRYGDELLEYSRATQDMEIEKLDSKIEAFEKIASKAKKLIDQAIASLPK